MRATPRSGCTGASCATSRRRDSPPTTWAEPPGPRRTLATPRTASTASRPASGPRSSRAAACAGRCAPLTSWHTAWPVGWRRGCAPNRDAMLSFMLPLPIPRAARAVETRLRQVRAHPVLNPVALEEAWRERARHPVAPDHRPHVLAALEWLARAQDATGDGGIARGYSLAWDPYFKSRGWQPAYPETTGYIVPTLYVAAQHLDRPDLAERAERAARWEVEIQLPSGAVRGGVMGAPTSPAVFNTGQVLLGWLAAFAQTGSGVFAEAGLRLEAPEFTAAAAKNLRAVALFQHEDGWIPHCCLTDPRRPLLHTIAYAIRGLLEGGRVLRDAGLLARAAVAAVGSDGWLPGRFAAGWRPAVRWSCLTGQAQMANIWLRLFEITGEQKWLATVSPVLRFLKSTQNRTSRDPGLCGGIKGSFPLGGEYGPYQTLSWATKFFVDALVRDERISRGLIATAPAAVLA